MSSQLIDLLQLFRPPNKVKVSDWAEENFVLSSEYSAKSGLIQLERLQREPIDAIGDPRVQEIVLMVAIQMFKTLSMQIAAAHAICVDPGPILFVGYKDKDAVDFSKDRFTPMVRDIEALRRRVSPPKSRDANNTQNHKLFPGGSIDFVGSLSPANLAGRTKRYLFFDEVDKYDASSGEEGDPIALGVGRTVRFGTRRKILMACSPTIRGKSRIAKAYDLSDQRKPYVACHQCGTFQVLLWNQVRFDSKAPPEEAGQMARYQCSKCEALWSDPEKRAAVRNTVEWRAGASFNGRAGFWFSHLYSTLALHSMSNLVETWLNSKGDVQARKVFIMTSLAELWEEDGEQPDHERLMIRAEPYPIGRDQLMNARIVFLTAGVDVQAKRLEIQVLGHAPGQTWVVDYIVIELFERDGQGIMTSAPEYWDALAAVLNSGYKHAATGVELPIIVMAIDVGYNPEPVYQFARRPGFGTPLYGPEGLIINSPRTVLCTRGLDSEHLSAISRITERETARMRKGAGKDLPIATLGTGYLKTELYAELLGRAEPPRVHLTRALQESYFRGLVAEKKTVSTTGTVSWERVYPRNEPLDTWVYAKGAYYAFRADRFRPDQWAAMRKRFGIPDPEPPAAPAEDKAKKPAPTQIPSPYLDEEKF